jgi:hypothetical protein
MIYISNTIHAAKKKGESYYIFIMLFLKVRNSSISVANVCLLKSLLSFFRIIKHQ